MNAAQRFILKVLLAIEALLILRPPFETRVGWRTFDLGYHWLPFLIFNGRPVRIDFAILAGQVVVVTVVGLTAVVLAKGIPDERIDALFDQFRALVRAFLNLISSSFAIFVLAVALFVSVVVLLTKIGAL
jgi:hypothetical protein